MERHVCVDDCEVFPDLPRSEWASHGGDTCSRCGERRFWEKPSSKGTPIFSPRKVCCNSAGVAG